MFRFTRAATADDSSANAAPTATLGAALGEESSAVADNRSINELLSSLSPWEYQTKVTLSMRIDGKDGLPSIQASSSQLRYILNYSLSWGAWSGFKYGLELTDQFPRKPSGISCSLHLCVWTLFLKNLLTVIKL